MAVEVRVEEARVEIKMAEIEEVCTVAEIEEAMQMGWTCEDASCSSGIGMAREAVNQMEGQRKIRKGMFVGRCRANERVIGGKVDGVNVDEGLVEARWKMMSGMLMKIGWVEERI
ncbi:hypothetical protein CYMTET_19621 [Cymbomonas tetramitiformis]|uniref:Uncharacterized protein n=1 Tax=Cymbomonas tetramitiformis TaxID=36881 RepID=A0AAE0G684_9CHLO|nr:hypothetical protein CYMTET_19621 [Cymbomonas tetramitiformis]